MASVIHLNSKELRKKENDITESKRDEEELRENTRL